MKILSGRSTEDTELLKDLFEKTLVFREKTLKQYILMSIQNTKFIRTEIRAGSEDLSSYKYNHYMKIESLQLIIKRLGKVLTLWLIAH